MGPILIIVVIAALAIIGVLGSLSIRSYILLPRKRKKQSELLARTQRYKDIDNLQAIVIINKNSGVPIFSVSYSILEKHKKELFSGFIQAITTIGENIVGKEAIKGFQIDQSKPKKREKLLELDFKYFYCSVYDKEDIRIVLILSEKPSERIKTKITSLGDALTLQTNEILENWDGSMERFEKLIPPIINDYIELYYKEPFVLNDIKYIEKIKRESELNPMETRTYNVIESITRNKGEFTLEYVVKSIHEQNKDKKIDAIESLIAKKIIIPKGV